MIESFSRSQFPKRKPGRPKGSVGGIEASKRRFWSRVRPGLPDECWPWLGKLDSQTGYAQFCWNAKKTSAHRFAWEVTFGPIPFGLFVCHKCDNRACQNPSHLWLGTASDNNKDMFRKGRNRNVGKPKITPDQGRLVRKLWIPYKMSIRKISERLGLPYRSCEYAVSKKH